jgi:hypothetical protein
LFLAGKFERLEYSFHISFGGGQRQLLFLAEKFERFEYSFHTTFRGGQRQLFFGGKI